MDIKETVTARLAGLGYTVAGADSFMIDFAVNKAEEQIKANINWSQIPEALFYVWADLAAGLFLRDKKATGQLAGYDFEAPAKGITEGDTRVEFAISDSTSPDARFEALTTKLTTLDEAALARFRRLVW